MKPLHQTCKKHGVRHLENVPCWRCLREEKNDLTALTLDLVQRLTASQAAIHRELEELREEVLALQ